MQSLIIQMHLGVLERQAAGRSCPQRSQSEAVRHGGVSESPFSYREGGPTGPSLRASSAIIGRSRGSTGRNHLIHIMMTYIQELLACGIHEVPVHLVLIRILDLGLS